MTPVGGVTPAASTATRALSRTEVIPGRWASPILRSSVSRGHSGSSWETAGGGRASDRRRRYSATSGGRRCCQGRRETPRSGKGRRSKTDARRPRQIQRAPASAGARVVRRGTTPVTRNGAVLAASQSNCKRARPAAPRPHAPRPAGRRRQMRWCDGLGQGAGRVWGCSGDRRGGASKRSRERGAGGRVGGAGDLAAARARCRIGGVDASIVVGWRCGGVEMPWGEMAWGEMPSGEVPWVKMPSGEMPWVERYRRWRGRGWRIAEEKDARDAISHPAIPHPTLDEKRARA